MESDDIVLNKINLKMSYMKDSFLRIKNMGMADIILMQVIIIQDHFKKEINMDLEFYIIKMDLFLIKDNGKMELEYFDLHYFFYINYIFIF